MSQQDLKEAERRLYLSYFDDGVIDFVAGLTVLFFGLGMLFSSATLFIFSWMPIVLFWPIKRALTLPRMGYVRFTPERQKKIATSYVLMLIAGVISVLLGLLAALAFEGQVFDLREFMMEYSLLIFGAVLASAFGLIALLFEIRRFYAYGLIVFGAWLSTYLLDIEAGIPVALSGGLVSAVGIFMLIRFLTQYPVRE